MYPEADKRRIHKQSNVLARADAMPRISCKPSSIYPYNWARLSGDSVAIRKSFGYAIKLTQLQEFKFGKTSRSHRYMAHSYWLSELDEG